MSQMKHTYKCKDNTSIELQSVEKDEVAALKPSLVTVQESLSQDQKSFICIHSTDQLCQLDNVSIPIECDIEILTHKEVFPSTSEESLNDEELPMNKNKINNHRILQKANPDNAIKSPYMPTNSKSTTVSRTRRQESDGQSSVFSDFNIPKSTLYVTGSNPGEPKMSYQDPPKKISKSMKKLFRNMDKQTKCEVVNSAATRGILKSCTGDSAEAKVEENESLQYPIDWSHYHKHNPDKNVSFNKQVVIIHFNGELCLGQSVETLSKEKDQQARNSELRKTYLTKYNEFWSK